MATLRPRHGAGDAFADPEMGKLEGKAVSKPNDTARRPPGVYYNDLGSGARDTGGWFKSKNKVFYLVFAGVFVFTMAYNQLNMDVQRVSSNEHEVLTQHPRATDAKRYAREIQGLGTDTRSPRLHCEATSGRKCEMRACLQGSAVVDYHECGGEQERVINVFRWAQKSTPEPCLLPETARAGVGVRVTPNSLQARRLHTPEYYHRDIPD